MKLIECGKRDEIFSHLENGEQTSLNVTKLEKAIDNIEVVLVPTDRDFAEWCYTNRGIEKHRLDRINEESFSYPITFLEWPDDTHLLVNGTHRFVKASQKGMLTLKARIVPEAIWRPFVIEDFPKVTELYLKTCFSGIP